MSSRTAIIGDVAKCVYDEDWAIYSENGKNHISAACFEVETIKNKTIDFIASCIKDEGTEAIIGFSEGTDQATIALASIVGYKLNIPSYKIMSGENDEPPKNLKSFSVLISYVLSKDQLSEILEKVESRGANVRQVIVLVDEDSRTESFCKQRGIRFQSLANIANILERLRLLRDVDKVRVKRIEEILANEKSGNPN